MRLTLKERTCRDIPFGLIYGSIALLSLLVVQAIPLSALLPVCTFKAVTGIPCPTCGTTRLLTMLAQGNLADAFCLNPAVALTILSALLLFLHDTAVLFSSSRLAFAVSLEEAKWVRTASFIALLVNWSYLIIAHRA